MLSFLSFWYRKWLDSVCKTHFHAVVSVSVTILISFSIGFFFLHFAFVLVRFIFFFPKHLNCVMYTSLLLYSLNLFHHHHHHPRNHPHYCQWILISGSHHFILQTKNNKKWITKTAQNTPYKYLHKNTSWQQSGRHFFCSFICWFIYLFIYLFVAVIEPVWSHHNFLPLYFYIHCVYNWFLLLLSLFYTIVYYMQWYLWAQ